MKRAREQLLEETTYPHLGTLLRSGGTLEVGENLSLRAFVRIRKGNKIVIVDAAYQDFAAILKEMDAKARSYLPEESGRSRTPGSE
ncbi:MAG: hypothetical protein ACYC3X_31650 [Pirellulaceae bacterium]